MHHFFKQVLTFALCVLQHMLFKRGISWVSKWFCSELWESFLQVGPLLFGTCKSQMSEPVCFHNASFCFPLRVCYEALTHSSEDSAVHAECDCNSSLAHSSRAWVDEHTLTRPQTPTHHHGVISCSVDHRYWSSLLQCPTHTHAHTQLELHYSHVLGL